MPLPMSQTCSSRGKSPSSRQPFLKPSPTLACAWLHPGFWYSANNWQIWCTPLSFGCHSWTAALFAIAKAPQHHRQRAPKLPILGRCRVDEIGQPVTADRLPLLVSPSLLPPHGRAAAGLLRSSKPPDQPGVSSPLGYPQARRFPRNAPASGLQI